MKQFLQEHDAYCLHKPAKYKFPWLKVRVNSLDEQADVDLMSMERYAKANDGIRYLLIVIDILSRYLRVTPLKNKKPESVVEGIKNILSDGRLPQKIHVDNGIELKGAFRSFVESYNIKLIVTQNEDIKANYAERVIWTLRSLLCSYLTHKNT